MPAKISLTNAPSNCHDHGSSLFVQGRCPPPTQDIHTIIIAELFTCCMLLTSTMHSSHKHYAFFSQALCILLTSTTSLATNPDVRLRQHVPLSQDFKHIISPCQLGQIGSHHLSIEDVFHITTYLQHIHTTILVDGLDGWLTIFHLYRRHVLITCHISATRHGQTNSARPSQQLLGKLTPISFFLAEAVLCQELCVGSNQQHFCVFLPIQSTRHLT